MNPTIMTGIKPTGRLHLGNYTGFITNILKYQKTHKIFLMIADGHAITQPRNPQQQSDDIAHLIAAL